MKPDGNLLARVAAAGLVALAATAACVTAGRGQGVEVEGLRQEFKACRAIVASDARLTCYDGLITKLEPPTFQGSLAAETPFFKVEGQTLLRYQSDGAIFVMYLKDAKGDVVQNLHIGGGGESSFLISKPGTYNLQVSGSESWRIWVEPQTGPGASHG